MEKLLTVSELAEMCGVPTQTVYRWNTYGTGPAVIKLGKHARYQPATVAAWLAAKTAKA